MDLRHVDAGKFPLFAEEAQVKMLTAVTSWLLICLTSKLSTNTDTCGGGKGEDAGVCSEAGRDRLCALRLVASGAKSDGCLVA
jgi:hypothetical protein